ncbi:MAG: LemA family protein [Bacteroidetes bacterium]|nr:LemA family protein [Bacteroidota bacterium]
MKKGTITLIAILGVLGLIVIWAIGIRNNIVRKDVTVTASWQQVENQYQRRSDLIPNLVAVVQQVADFEKGTLTAVIEARSKATSVTIDPSKMDENSMKKFQAAQGEVSSTLSRLLVVSEQYPQLKANENFRDLQTQLEGTENRIANERRIFNETVQGFNTYIRVFPNSIFAWGFASRPYFEADAGAEKAPKVKDLFNNK